jgi:SAM-dependent methyltransferase
VESDKAWKRFGDVDPYFGVLTEPQYRSGQMTEFAREEFFRSGEAHVEKVLKKLDAIRPGFFPGRSLDFGCGVGRVAIPLARTSGSVLGVDISPGMISEAEKNSRERGVNNVAFAHTIEGQFSLVHSYIVLQHIPPRRGLKTLADLASRVEFGGMIVLQLPYHRDASALRKIVTIVKRRDSLINTAINLAEGRRFSYPTMTMFCYKMSSVLKVLHAAGFRDLHVELDEPDKGYNCMTLYGEKTVLNLCTDAAPLFTAVTRSCLLLIVWNAWTRSAPDPARVGRGTNGRIASAASAIESSAKP